MTTLLGDSILIDSPRGTGEISYNDVKVSMPKRMILSIVRDLHFGLLRPERTNGLMELILASQSPRRAELLKQAGYAFEVRPPSPGAECGICSRESPPELVARLAWQKAADVARHVASGTVVACDTVAECMGQILGKPASREHAREMLLLMSGRTHHVYSGLCLWQRPGDRTEATVEVTRLQMQPLTEEQIDAYLDRNLWQGKAGAFGFQDGLDWVDIVSGSESNVVGLPMEQFGTLLERMQSSP